MTASELEMLAKSWLALWNGNLDLLDAVVSEDIVVHAVSPDGGRLEDVRGRAALGETIRQVHACFSEKTSYQLGPIIQDPFFVVRWHSTGAYRGGVPGVPDTSVGQPIDWHGIDIVRVENARVVEFWMSADTTVLWRQIGLGQQNG